MGERIVITGASGGIGQALAKVLAAQGHSLLLCGRNRDKLATLLAQLPDHRHELLVADLTDATAVAQLAQRAATLRVSGVINALGINPLATLEGLGVDAMTQQLQTNLLAPIAVCQALLPQLKLQEQGFILNVGSILGSIGFAGSTVYCASKFGLRGFTEALRRELADTSIKVGYIAPRATATELNSVAMNELNQALGNQVDSAEWVALQLQQWLARRRPGNRYLGWPEALWVRLNALFPTLMDGALAKQLATIKQFCLQPNRG